MFNLRHHCKTLFVCIFCIFKNISYGLLLSIIWINIDPKDPGSVSSSKSMTLQQRECSVAVMVLNINQDIAGATTAW